MYRVSRLSHFYMKETEMNSHFAVGVGHGRSGFTFGELMQK